MVSCFDFWNVVSLCVFECLRRWFVYVGSDFWLLIIVGCFDIWGLMLCKWKRKKDFE